MKRIKEILMPLFYILITVILATNFIIEVSTTTVYADVGSFEDYSSSGSSSSSDWGGSSWGSSSSSWDSSSGSDWDSSSRGSSSSSWDDNNFVR